MVWFFGKTVETDTLVLQMWLKLVCFPLFSCSHQHECSYRRVCKCFEIVMSLVVDNNSKLRNPLGPRWMVNYPNCKRGMKTITVVSERKLPSFCAENSYSVVSWCWNWWFLESCSLTTKKALRKFKVVSFCVLKLEKQKSSTKVRVWGKMSVRETCTKGTALALDFKRDGENVEFFLRPTYL